MAEGRPRALGYDLAFDAWARTLPEGHFDAIDRHMRSKTISPQLALSSDPEDASRFTTFVAIQDVRHPRLGGYRIDYEITGLAVIVIAGRRIPRRR
jgi:hypothetical protein